MKVSENKINVILNLSMKIKNKKIILKKTYTTSNYYQK